MALFNPDRSLLFPQFESYRLRSLDPATDLSFHALPGPGATQSRMGHNQQHLSFKEVRARIGWDHLSVGEGGRGVYVDQSWGVVGFVIGDNLEPEFTKLADLPEPISSTEQQFEFPSVLALDPTHWAISTGSGSLYVIETKPPGEPFTGEIISRHDLHTGQQPGDAPFLLRAVHVVAPQDVRLLITRSIYPSGTDSRSGQPTLFELSEVSLDPSSANGGDASPGILDVRWSRQGKDLPVWCTQHGEGWLVLSEEEFREMSKEVQKAESREDERKKERDSKIGKLGLGASLPAEEAAPSSSSSKDDEAMALDEKPVFPYSWTQTSDALDIVIPVAPSTTRGDVNVGLASTSLSVSLSNTPTQPLQLAEFLSRPRRSLWSSIDLDESTWTFDSSKNLIELDLRKMDENVRWPSVFSPPGIDEDEEEEEEVPETLSASTLAAVRETFNNIKTRGADEPDLPHPAIPALLREEMDFDLDDGEDFGETEGTYAESGGGSKVGREVLVGWLETGTGRGSWSKATSSVISLPLPGSSTSTSVILKHAVDGLVYEPDNGEPGKKPWRHVSTNPALAFVISSKRDLRLIRHLTFPSATSPPSSLVLAFDSGSSSAGQGNLYVYYPPTSKTTAQQSVLPLSGGERGALLGVGALKIVGRDVAVALCEKQLVIIKGLAN